MRAPGRLLVVGVLIVLAAGGAAAQQTIYVDDDTCPDQGSGTPGAPFCKVQEAVCSLRSAPAGGTVLVRPGTYYETVRMFKNVSLVSTDGPTVTTIDAAGRPCIDVNCNPTTSPCSVVQFSNLGGGGATPNDRLEGFTLRGGGGTALGVAFGGSRSGGGIHIFNASPTITRNVITGNVLSSPGLHFHGGGIYVGGGTGTRPLILGNVIEGNVADTPAGTNPNGRDSDGGGIYVFLNAAPRIENNVIRHNRAGSPETPFQNARGGGIAIRNAFPAFPPVVTRNHIYGNVAADFGGGVSLFYYQEQASRARIQDNLIEGNSADMGGAILSNIDASEIVNNTITHNLARLGAGVGAFTYSIYPTPRVANNLVTYNQATEAGGGIHVVGGQMPTIDHNDLFGNENDEVVAGDGNLSVDPRYVDLASVPRDFRLQPDSPVIDQGLNAVVGEVDLDGAPRIQDGNGDGVAVVDMGAFEYGPDFDGDGAPDWQDLDDDNDGAPDAEDCAPLHPSAWAPAVELSGLHVGEAEVSWSGQGPGFVYDVIGGALSSLHADGGVSAALCLANDLVATSWTDPAPDPAPGEGIYYLARAQNACGPGSYGASSAGAHREPATECPSW